MIGIDISNMEEQGVISFVDKNISDFKNFELMIHFKAEYSQSKIIRWLVLYLFEKNNINVPWKNRFSLISDELVNNSIEHWSLPLDKNVIIIKFSSSDNFLNINIEVHDTWKWPFAKNSFEMEKIRQEKESVWFELYMEKRWRWLFQLVKNIVDNLYFKDKQGWWLIVGVSKKLELAG